MQTHANTAVNADLIQQFSEQLFSEDAGVRAKAIEQLTKLLQETTAQSPGFFTPYRSVADVGATLMSPFRTALACSIALGLATMVASLAALTAAYSLVFAGGGALFGRSSFASAALDVCTGAALVAAIATVFSAAAILMAAILIPLSIATIVTRSLATVGSATSDLFSCCACVAEDAEQPGMPRAAM